MKYKIMFLDIDGTLINSNKKITQKTKEALISIQENGIKVAIASGRPDQGVLPLAEELKLEKFGGYILPFNGAKIKNCETEELIYEIALPLETVKKAYDFAKENNVELITYKDNHIISETIDNKYLEIEARINGLEIEKVSSIIEALENAPTKCLILGDGDCLAELEPQLKSKIGDIANVFRSEPFFLEVMPKGIDKAVSIENLIGKLDIKRSETIACGDGFNDISMVKYAGLGVAMENGCDEIKKVADYITASNNDDGIVKVIDKFIKFNQENSKILL